MEDNNNNEMLCQPMIIYQPDEQLLLELSEFRKDNIAFRHYVIGLYRRVFEQLRQPRLLRIVYLKSYFEAIVQASYEGKIRRIELVRKGLALRKVMKVWQCKRRDQSIKNKVEEFYERRVMNHCFKCWNMGREIAYKSKQVVKQRQRNQLKLWWQINQLKALRIPKNDFEADQFLKEKRDKSLLKQTFTALVIDVKVSRIQTKITKKYLNHLLTSIRTQQNSQRALSTKFQTKKLLQTAFTKWYDDLAITKSLHFIQYISKKQFFTHLRKYKYYQTQLTTIISNNNMIIQTHRNRHNKLLLLNILQHWHVVAGQQRYDRHHLLLMRKCSQMKRKQTLLSNCFYRLTCYVQISRVQKWHQARVRQKVIEGFKVVLCRQAKKLERVDEFMQRREIGRYFQAIKRFVKEEQDRLKQYGLNKAFKRFSLAVVLQYRERMSRAQNYHKQNLYFKAIYTFKLELNIKSKQEYLIKQINIIKPIRKWLKEYRIRRFQRERQRQIKTIMFRQWKISQIRSSYMVPFSTSDGNYSSNFQLSYSLD